MKPKLEHEYFACYHPLHLADFSVSNTLAGTVVVFLGSPSIWDSDHNVSCVRCSIQRRSFRVLEVRSRAIHTHFSGWLLGWWRHLKEHYSVKIFRCLMWLQLWKVCNKRKTKNWWIPYWYGPRKWKAIARANCEVNCATSLSMDDDYLKVIWMKKWNWRWRLFESDLDEKEITKEKTSQMSLCYQRWWWRRREANLQALTMMFWRLTLSTRIVEGHRMARWMCILKRSDKSKERQ